MPKKSRSAGRPAEPTSKSGRIRALLGSGMSTAEIAAKVGCTPALVYNVKSAMGGAKAKGRPAKASKSFAIGSGLDGVLNALREAERQQNRQRAALERIQAVLRDALA